MRKVLCFIGILHDWESIESCSKWRLTHKADERPPVDYTGRYYSNKVCLACGKHVNEIERFKKKELLAEQKREARKQKAKEYLVSLGS